MEAFDQVGTQVGESSFTLPAGGRKAKLLLELIPATAGQMGGYFRVRSGEEILSLPSSEIWRVSPFLPFHPSEH